MKRLYSILTPRPPRPRRPRQRDERGSVTTEWLIIGAVAALGVVAIGETLFDDILDGVLETIRGALP